MNSAIAEEKEPSSWHRTIESFQAGGEASMRYGGGGVSGSLLDDAGVWGGGQEEMRRGREREEGDGGVMRESGGQGCW